MLFWGRYCESQKGSTSAGIATIGYYDNQLPLFNAKAGSMQEVLNVIQSQHEF